jgi:hypothetical protein
MTTQSVSIDINWRERRLAEQGRYQRSRLSALNVSGCLLRLPSRLSPVHAYAKSKASERLLRLLHTSIWMTQAAMSRVLFSPSLTISSGRWTWRILKASATKISLIWQETARELDITASRSSSWSPLLFPNAKDPPKKSKVSRSRELTRRIALRRFLSAQSPHLSLSKNSKLQLKQLEEGIRSLLSLISETEPAQNGYSKMSHRMRGSST